MIESTMKWTVVLWIAVCAVLAGGCATSSPPPISDLSPVDSQYRIGSGDGLRIYVRDNPDLSLSVPVRPDGDISIPLVETIPAAGKTPVELAGDLETALSVYVRDPLVTVIVTSFVGTYSDQVRILGEASRPQSIPFSNGMSLLDVMINVGGLTRFAAGNRAKLIRVDAQGNKQTYGVNIQDLLDGQIDQNLPLRPGDVIIIPQTYF